MQDIMKMSWRRVQNVLKTSWRCLQHAFARRLQDVLKTSWRGLGKMPTSWQDVLKMSWGCFEDVFARRLEDVLKTSWRRLGKRSWRSITKTNMLFLTKTSWTRLLKTYDWGDYIRLDQDVLKMSSEDEGERRFQDVFIETNVCWDISLAIMRRVEEWEKLIKYPLTGKEF